MFKCEQCDCEALYKYTVSRQVKCKECKAHFPIALFVKIHVKFGFAAYVALANTNQSPKVDLKHDDKFCLKYFFVLYCKFPCLADI